jgi:acyl-CoA synthetase (AMP-forming)/AMP-acid ligase II
MTAAFPTVLEAVLARAESTPDKTAVVDRSGKTTYAELAAMIRTAAANLQAAGVRKGGRVMLAAVPYARFVAAYFACHYIGAVACPVDKNAVKDTLLWMRDFLETEAVFYEGPLAGELGFRDLGSLLAPGGAETGPPAKLDGGDLAAIIFTSATTGKPKGVMLTHRNMSVIAENRVSCFSLSPSTVWLVPSTLYHIGALGFLCGTLYTCGTIVMEDTFASLRNLYIAVTENKVDGIYCTPAAMQILYAQTKNQIAKVLGGLKKIVFDAMPLPMALKERVLADLPGADIYNMYGVTEASGIITINYRADTGKLESIGRAAPGVRVGIEGNGDTGRLVVEGGMVMRGYWRDEAAARAALSGGRLIINDAGFIDKDGYVYLLGRTDDIINTGGNKVSPLEIEEAAYTLPYIGECCAVGVDDAVQGSVPVLFVSLSEQEVERQLRRRLDSYKAPKRIIPLKEIPKNAMGKPLRRELAELWRREYAGKI